MELGDSSSASRGGFMTKQKVKTEMRAAAEGDDFAFPAIINNDDDLLGDNNSSDHQDEKKKTRAGGGGGGGCGKKGSNSAAGGGGGGMRICQADKCTADLTDAKQYHRRHKVCEHHAKAQVVVVAGIRQRFCQQCSRFHELPEFDESKRSCRRRLAGHNERRRKNSTTTAVIDSQAEGSSSRKAGTGSVCGQVDDHRGRIQMTLQDNPTNYKHFQIR